MFLKFGQWKADEKKEKLDKPKTEEKKQVQIETTTPYQQELRNYLQLRKGQIEAIIPTLDALYDSLYGRGIESPVAIAKKQVSFLQSIIIQLDDNPQIAIRNLKDIPLSRPELRIFWDDIDAILRTGETVMPANLADIPKYFAEKKAERAASSAAIRQKEKAQKKAIEVAQITEKKKARRKQLEDELGVKLS